MKNIFQSEITQSFISRINQLKPDSQPLWGRMSVAQMLAHCSVTYELVYEDMHPKPNFFMKIILKSFVKKYVVGEKVYDKNVKTAPYFIIKSDKDFEFEKKRLISFINKTQQLGEHFFEGKESVSFGKLTASEWNNMFYKHLDHHLNQFGV